MPVGVRVEISVESVDGVLVAARAGADRVELCTGLADGGLTPSAGLVREAARVAGRTDVHVLVRPRPGDFVYSPVEISVMLRDIEVARDNGAAGVVVGVLDAAGEVGGGCADLVAVASGMEVTFHRAIDVAADPRRVLETVVELGFDRVLTSGRARSVLEGAAVIRELVGTAAGRVEVMACGGVRAGNAARVLAETGVRDLHAAVRVPVRGAAGELFAGAGVPAGFDRFAVDPVGVAELCAVAEAS